MHINIKKIAAFFACIIIFVLCGSTLGIPKRTWKRKTYKSPQKSVMPIKKYTPRPNVKKSVFKFIAELGIGYNSLNSVHSQGTGTSEVELNGTPSFLSLNGKLEVNTNGKVFFGINSIVPIAKNAAKESARLGSIPAFTTDLTYKITNIDVYAGYIFSNILTSYGGISLYKAELLRENPSIDLSKVKVLEPETINRLNIILGIRGKANISSLGAGYNVEAALPIISNITDGGDTVNIVSGSNISVKGNVYYSISRFYAIKGELLFQVIRTPLADAGTLVTQNRNVSIGLTHVF